MPYRIDGSVFVKLFEDSAGQPLFPNLQVLSWQRSWPDEDLSMLARIIAPPTLSVLKLHHPMWLDYKPRFIPAYFKMDGRPEDLQIFTDAYPMLEHIVIDLIFPSHDLCCISNCRHLRSFSVEQVPLNVLWPLAQLPSLTHLDVELLGEESSAPLPTSPLELAPFSSLTTVTFHSSHALPVIGFLTHISPIALTSVNLRLVRAHSDDIPRALRALCSDRLVHTLRVIRVNFECVEAGQDSESERCHFLAVARPLLNLPSLDVLAFSVHGRALVLSDNDVSEMARSWPRIVSLSVTHDPKYIDPKDRPRGTHYSSLVRPSLSALVSLAEQCGNLESMKFDPADVSEEELVSLEAHAASAIAVPRATLGQFVPARSDAFDRLVIHDVQRLASALHRIFPNLEGKGVIPEHERRPIQARLTDGGTGSDSQADELLRCLDALCAEEKRGVQRGCAAS